jgi:hypothetical protein
MTPTVENAIELLRQLPPPELEEVRDWIDEEKKSNGGQNKKSELERKNEKFKRALNWIEENKEEYDGQFVLLEGGDLIAHGTNPKELYETARNKGIKIPFVKRVKAKELPFGGW